MLRPFASRIWRHVLTDRADVDRAFPEEALARIERAIADGETRHGGQVCFAVEAALPPVRLWRQVTPRERALEVFAYLRVWDTERNDGVLVYLLLADRDVEIVADRGIHRAVGNEVWEAICRTMEAHFREGRFAEGVTQGVTEIETLLAQHSPRTLDDTNELADRPVVL